MLITISIILAGAALVALAFFSAVEGERDYGQWGDPYTFKFVEYFDYNHQYDGGMDYDEAVEEVRQDRVCRLTGQVQSRTVSQKRYPA